MVAREQIAELVGRIVAAFRPLEVILFGSHADGTATGESDVDLLVVMPCPGKPAVKAAEILSATTPSFPVDLVVRDPGELERRLQAGDYFLRHVVAAGEVLYEAAHR